MKTLRLIFSVFALSLFASSALAQPATPMKLGEAKDKWTSGKLKVPSPKDIFGDKWADFDAEMYLEMLSATAERKNLLEIQKLADNQKLRAVLTKAGVKDASVAAEAVVIYGVLKDWPVPFGSTAAAPYSNNAEDLLEKILSPVVGTTAEQRFKAYTDTFLYARSLGLPVGTARALGDEVLNAWNPVKSSSEFLAGLQKELPKIKKAEGNVRGQRLYEALKRGIGDSKKIGVDAGKLPVEVDGATLDAVLAKLPADEPVNVPKQNVDTGRKVDPMPQGNGPTSDSGPKVEQLTKELDEAKKRVAELEGEKADAKKSRERAAEEKKNGPWSIELTFPELLVGGAGVSAATIGGVLARRLWVTRARKSRPIAQSKCPHTVERFADIAPAKPRLNDKELRDGKREDFPGAPLRQGTTTPASGKIDDWVLHVHNTRNPRIATKLAVLDPAHRNALTDYWKMLSEHPDERMWEELQAELDSFGEMQPQEMEVALRAKAKALIDQHNAVPKKPLDFGDVDDILGGAPKAPVKTDASKGTPDPSTETKSGADTIVGAPKAPSLDATGRRNTLTAPLTEERLRAGDREAYPGGPIVQVAAIPEGTAIPNTVLLDQKRFETVAGALSKLAPNDQRLIRDEWQRQLEHPEEAKKDDLKFEIRRLWSLKEEERDKDLKAQAEALAKKTQGNR